MVSLAGRLGIVTGANAGIGSSIARRLVQEGMKVVGWDKDTDKMQSLKEEVSGAVGEFHPMKLDLRNEEDIIRAFMEVDNEFGDLHLMVNNAAVLDKESILEGETQKWKDIVNVNFLSTAICSREAIAYMRERGIDDGHVINMSSIHGHYVLPFTHTHFYSATKYAIRALTEGIRQELRDLQSGIRVGSISPGIVDTSIYKAANIASDIGKRSRICKEPLKPSDVADLLVYMIKQPGHIQIHDAIVHAHNEQR